MTRQRTWSEQKSFYKHHRTNKARLVNQPELKDIAPQIPVLPDSIYLDNGTEMTIIPMAATEIVTICLMFKGGQWMQKRKLQSDYAMYQIKSGTSRFTSEFLADKLDYYGATMSAGNGMTHSFVQLTSLKRTLPQVLPYFCDILTTPVYEQSLLNNAIEEGVLTFQMQEQQVAQVSKRMFYQQLLGTNHPAAAYATEEDYQSLTREDLLSYHSQFINMSNATVFLTGMIDAKLIALINEHLGKIPTITQSGLEYKEAEIVTSAEQFHEKEIGVPSVQSGLRIGKVMPDCNSADYPAIMLTSTILGGYFGSRLMKNIREELGLTYGIHSTFFPIPGNNIFFITTETTREYVPQCIEEIKREILDLQSNPVSGEELKNARNYNLGQFCRATEITMSLHHLIMNLRTQQRTLGSILKEQQTALALTSEDIMLCARKYFDPESMLITVAHGKSPCSAV